LLPRHAVLGRVVLGERNVFCGMHESPLGPMEADPFVGNAVATSLATGGLLVSWHDVLDNLERKAKTR